MLFEGRFNLQGRIQDIWDFLLQPEMLATAIPSCEKWEAIDERTFESVVAAKVGFISVKFLIPGWLTWNLPDT